MVDFEEIKLDSEVEKGAYFCREAIKQAEAGNFERAVEVAETILKYDFKLNILFKDEALLSIIYGAAKQHSLKWLKALFQKSNRRRVTNALAK